MILTSSKGKHNSRWLSSEEICPLTQLLTLETGQSPGLFGWFLLSAAPATVGFILQIIPSALQDDCESVKIVFPFSPGKSHGQRGLAGCSPKGCKESDKTERLSTHTGKRERKFTSMKHRLLPLIWSGAQAVHTLPCTTVARRLPWAGRLGLGSRAVATKERGIAMHLACVAKSNPRVRAEQRHEQNWAPSGRSEGETDAGEASSHVWCTGTGLEKQHDFG